MMKTLLASIRKQPATAPADEAGQLVARARAEHEQAETALGEARAAYQRSLTDEDEGRAVAAREAVTRCEVRVDRAAAAIGLAEERHAEAVAREAEAERARRYAEAQASIREAKKALGGYTAHALAIRGILRKVAEANVALAAANADLPAGAAALVAAEAQVRGVPAAPERVLSRQKAPDAWVYMGTHGAWGDVEPDHVANIRATGPTTGILTMRNPEGYEREYPVMRLPDGSRVTYLPAKTGVMPIPLNALILLPGLHATDPMVWTPCGDPSAWYGVGGDAGEVLERLAEREAAPRQTLDQLQPDGAQQERIERPTLAPTADIEDAA